MDSAKIRADTEKAVAYIREKAEAAAQAERLKQELDAANENLQIITGGAS